MPIAPDSQEPSASRRAKSKPLKIVNPTRAVERLRGQLPPAAHAVLTALLGASYEHGVRRAALSDRVRAAGVDPAAISTAIDALETEGLATTGTKREAVLIGYADAAQKQPLFTDQDTPFVWPLRVEQWESSAHFLAAAGLRLPTPVDDAQPDAQPDASRVAMPELQPADEEAFWDPIEFRAFLCEIHPGIDEFLDTLPQRIAAVKQKEADRSARARRARRANGRAGK